MDKPLERIRRNPRNVRFNDLRKLCNRYFGKPRQRGSHLSYPMPWAGDPRVNFQNRHGSVAPYQVRQVLAAIEKLGAMK